MFVNVNIILYRCIDIFHRGRDIGDILTHTYEEALYTYDSFTCWYIALACGRRATFLSEDCQSLLYRRASGKAASFYINIQKEYYIFFMCCFNYVFFSST